MANISNSTANTLVKGTSSADSIVNSAQNVTIHGGKGNDTVTGSSNGEVFQFRSDGGNDVITNFGANDTLYISAGSLSTYYADGNDLIIGAKGAKYSGTVRLKDAADDLIKVKVGKSKITTLNTINHIDAYHESTLISGTGRRDSIDNYASGATINGGAGNDTIHSYGGWPNAYQFSSDGGHDLIMGFQAEYDTLQITAGSISTYYIDGDDAIVSVKGAKYAGSVTLASVGETPIHVRNANGTSRILAPYPLTVNGTDGNDALYNERDYVTVKSGKGNDTIDNTGQYAVINGGAGDDHIENYGNGEVWGTTLIGGSGNDEIYSRILSYGSVSGGNGNDYISGSYYGTSIKGGAGNDTIEGWILNVFQFGATDGNDVIYSFSGYDSIQITDGSISSHYVNGEDYVINVQKDKDSGAISVIGAGAGTYVPIQVRDSNGRMSVLNSKIYNYDSDTVVSGTNKNDTIFNGAYGATVNAGKGNDVIMNMDSARINAGAGNDFVNLYGFSSTVDGGAGNDSIYGHESAHHSINGGAGNDYIYGNFGGSTIRGGAGNDIFNGYSAYGVRYQFGSADGHDTIYNYSTDDMLQITAGTLATYYPAGDDLLVSVKGAKYSGTVTFAGAAVTPIEVRAGRKTSTINVLDTIENYNPNTVISGTNKRDLIYNYATNVTINSGKDADYISNEAQNVIINAGDGKDYVVSADAYVTINVGADNDTVRGYFEYNSIIGGAGNDYILGNYYSSTINGGSGNDTVEIWNEDGGGSVVQFSSKGGNDLITGFGANDTLNITDGSIGTYYVDGEDMIVSVKGSKANGTVTLQGAAELIINVRNAKGKMSTLSNYNIIENDTDRTLVSGTGKNDKIYNYGYNVTINAGDGNDIIGGDLFYATINGGAGDDTISGYSEHRTYLFGASDGHDVIEGFRDDATIKITSGTIGSNYYDGQDYIIEVIDSQNAGSITIKDVGPTPIRVHDTEGEEIFVNYDLVNVRYDKINGTKKAERIFNDSYNSTINGGAGNDTIYCSYWGRNASINGGAGADYIYGYAEHSTLNGGTGNDTFNTWGDSTVYQLSSNGGKDLIMNFSEGDTLQITDGAISTYYSTDDGYVLSIEGDKSSSSVTLQGITEEHLIVVRDSDNSISVLNYDVSNVVSNKKVNGTKKAERVYNAGQQATINAGAGNDTILNYGATSFINAGAGNDIISSKYHADYRSTIYGGAGNDSIYDQGFDNWIDGGDGNDYISGDFNCTTIRGGAGNDTISQFVYGFHTWYQFGANDGNDWIWGFDEEDILQIVEGSITAHYATDEGDYIVEVGSAARVTISGFGDNPIRVIDADNVMKMFNSTDTDSTLVSLMEDTVFSGTNYADYIFNPISNATINAGAGDDTIKVGEFEYYSEASASIFVDGGAGNDSICGYIYDSTFKGGTGDDTIETWGGDNVYQFGSSDGNDFISGFWTNDTLHITKGSIYSYYADGDNFVLKVKSGKNTASVTLQGMAYNSIAVRDVNGEMSYLTAETNSELPAPSPDDYWFTEEQSSNDSPLEQIVSTEHAVDLDFDQLSETFKPNTLELTASARNRHRK